MKKPEDFLMQHIKERCYYPDSNINMVDEKGALAALKAMSEDHDAEMQSHANKDGWVKERVKCATLCAGCEENCHGREVYFSPPKPQI